MKQLSGQFGLTVRRAREQLGWSQEVLADRASLNRSYLGEVERGSAMPSLATIAKLAAALNTNISELLARCENQGDAFEEPSALIRFGN